MIVGICGGSGSGKTTLLKRLCKQFEHVHPSVFSMDNYYHPIDRQHMDENGFYNFDLPQALDEQRLVEDLRKLISGVQIEVKEYHFNSPPDKHVLLTIEPSELIIVEGLFLFHYKGVRELLDYSVFINVDAQTQLDRRLYRDQETRGYSREAILYQWENHVEPCYRNYLLPYRKEADFQFSNDHQSDADFARLVDELLTRMNAVANDW